MGIFFFYLLKLPLDQLSSFYQKTLSGLKIKSFLLLQKVIKDTKNCIKSNMMIDHIEIDNFTYWFPYCLDNDAKHSNCVFTYRTVYLIYIIFLLYTATTNELNIFLRSWRINKGFDFWTTYDPVTIVYTGLRGTDIYYLVFTLFIYLQDG